jgi:hypothetical protein
MICADYNLRVKLFWPKLHIWVQNFIHGYKTSFLGSKHQTWVQNFIPGHKTSFLGSKISYLGTKLQTLVKN